jgi:phosphoglycolate phosphatase-like HAD superfamily hydrolase
MALASLSVWRIHRRIGMITRGQVQRAKPDPDLFLAAAQSLKVSLSRAIVVGDSVWDLLAARRAGCLGIGLLSGDYGREEPQQVGAYRVYQDPADLVTSSRRIRDSALGVNSQ